MQSTQYEHVLLTCTGCSIEYMGDRQRLYCTEKCKWRAKAKRKYIPTPRGVRLCNICKDKHYAHGLCVDHYWATRVRPKEEPRRKSGVCAHCSEPWVKDIKSTNEFCHACSIHFRSMQRKTNWPQCGVYIGDCEQCSSLFVSQRVRKYCGANCLKAAHPYIRPTTCARCGNEREFGKTLCAPCREAGMAIALRAHRQKRRAVERGVEAERIVASKVYERDGWVCGICGESVNKADKYPHRRSPSLDHIVPISKGGPHVYSNVQLAHWDCNVITKKDQIPA